MTEQASAKTDLACGDHFARHHFTPFTIPAGAEMIPQDIDSLICEWLCLLYEKNKFISNPTRTEDSRWDRFQGNSFALMSSRELIKHSLPTLSAEPLQAHSTLIFAFYCKSNQSLLLFCGPASVERTGSAALWGLVHNLHQERAIYGNVDITL